MREFLIEAILGSKRWQAYKGVEPYKPKEGLPHAVICDIDGTLAHMNGKRGPFEWDKVGLDDVDRDVRFIIDQYSYALGVDVILLSGRDSVCRELTEEWLSDNLITYKRLFMREQGDHRKDYVVKRELFDKHIRDKYDVLLVIDDRPQVLRLWHSLGLKTLSMGDQNLEF